MAPNREPFDELARWAADARAEEAAAGRARERWLRRQAEEEGTVAGVLLDLAERGAAVLVCTIAGRRHAGRVAAAGDDFVALRTTGGRQLLIPHRALAWIRPADGDPTAPAGDRPLGLDLDVGAALAVLAGDRPRVHVVAQHEDAAISGELVAVGRDVLTVRPDGTGTPVAYVPIETVSEIGFG